MPLERAENRFLTAIPPPPKAPQNVDPNWPAWRFHKTLGAKLVRNQHESEELGEGWGTKPHPEPEKTPQEKAASAAGDTGALLAIVNRMNAENERLVAENMRLTNIVQDSADAARVTELELELKSAKNAAKSLQDTIDKMVRGRDQERKARAAERKAETSPETEPDTEQPSDSFLDALRNSATASEELDTEAVAAD